MLPKPYYEEEERRHYYYFISDYSHSPKTTLAAVVMQCVAAGLVGAVECRPFLAHLSLPPPLRPLLLTKPSSHYGLLATPLFLLAISLLVLSLLASHKLSKTPIHRLGHVGTRGRKYFSWNEATTGDCGGRFCDWWVFGGSVWIRAILRFWDLMSGVGVGGDEGHESGAGGGENIFACFGIAKNVSHNTEAEMTGHSGSPIEENTKQPGGSFGILGYDTSLGAHGPLVLAPLRASVLLLAWLSICSFMVMTHKELVSWMASTDQMSTTSYGDKLMLFTLYIIQGIQSIMNRGNVIRGDMHSKDPVMNVLLTTIAYASVIIATAELCLYTIGKVLTTLSLYVPQGVSNPGGPRPRKIVRMPKWEEGKIHVLPKTLLSGDNSDVNSRQWRCAVAHDAHRDTDAKFGRTISQHLNQLSALTGEPFGRQIWTTLVAQPIGGQGGTEDDLESILLKEFPITPAKSQNGTKHTSEGKSGQDKTEKSNQPDVIGNFLQSFLKPDKQPQSKGQKSEQAEDERNKLIQVLSSGGRSPLAFDPSSNPNSCDQLFRAQMISSYLEKSNGALPDDISYLLVNKPEGDVKNLPKSAMEAAKRGIAFYSMLQTADGHFAGDYGGPHFLLPGLVVSWYVMGRPSVMISPSQQALMLHYLMVHQQEDGGWVSEKE